MWKSIRSNQCVSNQGGLANLPPPHNPHSINKNNQHRMGVLGCPTHFLWRSAVYLMNNEVPDEKLPRILLHFNAIKIETSLMKPAQKLWFDVWVTFPLPIILVYTKNIIVFR